MLTLEYIFDICFNMTLEEYRLENNLSYKKLAEKLGFKEATVVWMVFTKKITTKH